MPARHTLPSNSHQLACKLNISYSVCDSASLTERAWRPASARACLTSAVPAQHVPLTAPMQCLRTCSQLPCNVSIQSQGNAGGKHKPDNMCHLISKGHQGRRLCAHSRCNKTGRKDVRHRAADTQRVTQTQVHAGVRMAVSRESHKHRHMQA